MKTITAYVDRVSAYLLASSEDHTASYLVVREGLLINYPSFGGQEHRLMRADLVVYPTANSVNALATRSIA